MIEQYKVYLQSDAWKVKCRHVLKVWGNRCAICYSDDPLEVHHRTYERLGNELITDVLPLCGICHERFHLRIV